LSYGCFDVLASQLSLALSASRLAAVIGKSTATLTATAGGSGWLHRGVVWPRFFWDDKSGRTALLTAASLTKIAPASLAGAVSATGTLHGGPTTHAAMIWRRYAMDLKTVMS
jgi:hypothetical protein